MGRVGSQNFETGQKKVAGVEILEWLEQMF